MGLLQTLAGKINNDSSNFIHFGIPSDRVQNVKYDATPVTAGSGYFRVWAVEMKVADTAPLVDYYPVLHSVVGFDYAGKNVELTRLTSLDALKSSTGSGFDMTKVIALNFPLTELIPFNGGTVEISAGLVAMKQRDMLQALIAMASDFSSMLAVPQLSKALSLAQPLANNIEKVIGMGDNQFRLGYHNTFTSANGGGSNDLQPQYIAIIATKPGDTLPRDGAGHWIINDHLMYINPDPAVTNKTPQEVTRDYMLLRFEVRRSRDDWNSLSDLNQPFVDSLKLLAEDQNKSKAQLKRAILQILESPDVAENDRLVIAQELRKKYDDRAALLMLESTLDQDEEPITLGDALGEIGHSSSESGEGGGMSAPIKPMGVDEVLNF